MNKTNLIVSESLARNIYKSASVLDQHIWKKVNEAFIAKSIAELMHEVLIKPLPLGTTNGKTSFELNTDLPNVNYYFSGVHKKLDYWYILPGSIVKRSNEGEVKLNGLDFFMELQQCIGIKPHALTHFLEEIHRTLYADCFLETKQQLSANELADATYQQIEQQMNGHPWLIMNKGRVGFNYYDYTHYAPEAGNSIKLLWLAVHRSSTAFNSIGNLSYENLIQSELGAELVNEFNAIVLLKGLDPSAYYFMPVHEWQWNSKLVFLYASEIADKRIVPIAFGNDEYYAQQSIRTLYNKSEPQKHYVKTALTILNTTLYRGLSPEKLRVAPMMAEWVQAKLRNDMYLQACGFKLLNEVATLSYAHPHFGKIADAPYQYTEMLGVIWREGVASELQPTEKPMTMASLLYCDTAGESLLKALIQKSGLTVKQWIDAYLAAYFKPLLHCFYKHQLFFVPHGENVILIMENYIPVKVVLKDFVEEVQLAPDAYQQTPEIIKAVLYEIPEADVPLFIFVDIFVGYFRYLSALLSTKLDYSEDLFWKQVANQIISYQQQFPELEAYYKRYDLFVPEFRRFCLNRFRLVTFGYGESSTIPSDPPYAGMLENPIAVFKPAHVFELNVQMV